MPISELDLNRTTTYTSATLRPLRLTASFLRNYINGQQCVSRLPNVSPLMYSMTEAKLRTNARQDIRHLRIRCDAERLAFMGRAEPED